MASIPIEPNAALEPAEMLAQVVDMTRRIFGGKISVYEDRDLEYPDHSYTVVEAETDLSPQEIVLAEKQWVRALFEITPGENSPRLLIYPKP